jgi:hypothetical protein
MRHGLIGTAAAALALAPAGVASAATWTVNPNGGACNGSDHNCASIQAANAAVNASSDVNEVIEVMPRPGGWPGDVTFTESGLTVRGVGSEARVNGGLVFAGSGTSAQTFVLQRLTVLGQPGKPALSITSATVSGDKTVEIQSSILSGDANGADPDTPAIYASTAFSLNTIQINARHLTLADKDGAPGVVEDQNPDQIDTTFENSLTPSAAENGALFANPGAEDFHLRVGSPAIDQGGGQGAGEVTTDVDGESRTGTWDRGGDEFVNHAPSAPTLAAFNPAPRTGEAVGFSASGATDPDTALQDGIDTYRWDFGDGTVQDLTVGNPNFQQHAYAAAGTYNVTVRALDRAGGVSGPSNAATLTVTDPPPPAPGPGSGNTPVGPGGAGLPGIDPGHKAGPDTAPPFLAIGFPSHNARVRLGRAALTLRGSDADDSGVRRVELALARRQGTRCLWYDGRRTFRPGACSAVRWFRATVDDFAWRYAFPRTVRPAPGSYGLVVRGTDYLGNGSTEFSAAAKTAIGFTVVR